MIENFCANENCQKPIHQNEDGFWIHGNGSPWCTNAKLDEARYLQCTQTTENRTL